MEYHHVPQEIWLEIHRSADRVALEATRMQLSTTEAGDIYIQAYKKVW